jgi:hypothetical protein
MKMELEDAFLAAVNSSAGQLLDHMGEHDDDRIIEISKAVFEQFTAAKATQSEVLHVCINMLGGMIPSMRTPGMTAEVLDAAQELEVNTLTYVVAKLLRQRGEDRYDAHGRVNDPKRAQA